MPSLALLLIVASLFAAAAADAQQKNSWDSAIDSFAAKIAAIAGAHASVQLNVKNLSSLGAGRVADFSSALEAQLQQRGLKTESADTAAEMFDVTISENLRDIIFAATTKRGDSQEIALETLDRAKAEQKSGAKLRVRLQRELIWSQREPVLDFLVIPAAAADGARRLFVLEPRRLVVYRAAAEGWQVAESHPLLDYRVPRDARGFFAPPRSDSTEPFRLYVAGERCDLSLVGAIALNCGYDASPIVSMQRDFAAIGGTCGGGKRGLASGHGDWTEPDTLSVVAADGPYQKT
ncbi:MAG: hypothetical protein WCB14_01020, partial [Candidatus Acidiferrales bacterium]